MARTTKTTTKTQTVPVDDELYEVQATPTARGNGAIEEAVLQVVHDVPALKVREVYIPLVGVAPLICHNWSAKAKMEMLDKQMRKASAGKEAKDPEKDYWESLYHLGPDRFGFPTIAFKKAMVRAGSYTGQVMTVLRGAFHVMGEFVEIDGDPRPREDPVRVGKGTADIRYRAEFPVWRATLRIKYNTRVISEEQLLNLLQHAGFGVGVGDWRPEKDGSYGLFEVERGRAPGTSAPESAQ